MTPRELKRIRRRLGLSQSQFGGLVGVHANTVARWERGELGMKATTANLIRLVTAPGATRFSDDFTARPGEPVKSVAELLAELSRTRPRPTKKG